MSTDPKRSTAPSRGAQAFTAPYLAGEDLEETEALRRAGNLLFLHKATADLPPPARPRPPEWAIRGRLLLAAGEAEQLGLWLCQEPSASLVGVDSPTLGYLAGTAAVAGEALLTWAEGLRLAVLSPDDATGAAEGPEPLQAYRGVLSALAAALRPWGRRIRAAADRLAPRDESGEDVDDAAQEFAPWLAGFADATTRDIARLVAAAELQAEVTEETRDAYTAEVVGQRAEQIWRDIDPAAPRGGGHEPR